MEFVGKKKSLPLLSRLLVIGTYESIHTKSVIIYYFHEIVWQTFITIVYLLFMTFVTHIIYVFMDYLYGL